MPKRSHWFAFLLVLLWVVSPVWAEASPPQASPPHLSDQPPAAALRVYVEDPQSALTAALDLAGFIRVPEPEDADVILLNGTLSDSERLAGLVQEGK